MPKCRSAGWATASPQWPYAVADQKSDEIDASVDAAGEAPVIRMVNTIMIEALKTKVHGEKVVMRILDKANLAPGLASLGLDDYAYNAMKFAIDQPHGIILVTGPTGSGKTTTPYSCLQDLNQPNVNIVTAEDPVEYELAGILKRLASILGSASRLRKKVKSAMTYPTVIISIALLMAGGLIQFVVPIFAENVLRLRQASARADARRPSG